MKLLVAVVAVFLVSCSAPSTPLDGGAGGGSGGGSGSNGGGAGMPQTWRFTASPDGGLYSAGALTFDVPPGAVTAPVEIVIRETADTVAGHEALSALYVFEPDGLTFVQDVAVTVTLADTTSTGVLWWSVEGSDELEAVGLASNGVAEGFIKHFSKGLVSKKRQCIEPDGPGRSECTSCQATDDAGGALSKSGPDAGCGEWPPPNSVWTGREGAPCSGFALRDVEQNWCSCQMVAAPQEYLCPEPFIFSPNQQCPTDGGLNGFVDKRNGQTCAGYRTNGARTSGRIKDCQTLVVDTRLTRLNGKLEGCAATNPATPAGYALCDGTENPRNRTSQACAELLSEPNAGTTACKNADGKNLTPTESGSLGSRGGAFIENQLFSGPGQLTQFEVPNASKEDCGGMSGRPGYPDLMQLVPNDGTGPIQVRVGDVKPLTNSGLSKGRSDLHNCYFDAVDRAGQECAKTPVPDTHKAFCAALGSDGGRPVVVDRMNSVGFSPGEFCGPSVMNDGGPPQRYVGYECGPGITAFRCAD